MWVSGVTHRGLIARQVIVTQPRRVDDRVGNWTVIEHRLPTGCDRLKRARQLGQPEAFADPGGGPSPGGASGALLHTSAVWWPAATPVAANSIAGCRQALQAESSEALRQRGPSRHSSRNGHRPRAGPRGRFGGRVARCRSGGVEPEHVAAGIADDCEQVTADPGGVRFGHAQHGRGADRGVDGVAIVRAGSRAR